VIAKRAACVVLSQQCQHIEVSPGMLRAWCDRTRYGQGRSAVVGVEARTRLYQMLFMCSRGDPELFSDPLTEFRQGGADADST
jgi:hypothetical protein